MIDMYYNTLAEGPGVAREKKFEKKSGEKNSIFLAYNTPRPPMSVHKNVSPIGPAVLSAIDNIIYI